MVSILGGIIGTMPFLKVKRYAEKELFNLEDDIIDIKYGENDTLYFIDLKKKKTPCSVVMKEVESIDFDWENTFDSIVYYALIEKKEGRPLLVPAASLLIETHKRFGYGGYFCSCSDQLLLQNEGKVQLEDIRRLDIVNAIFNTDAKTPHKVEVTVETTDDEKFNDTINIDCIIYLRSLSKKEGVFSDTLDKITRITFLKASQERLSATVPPLSAFQIAPTVQQELESISLPNGQVKLFDTARYRTTGALQWNISNDKDTLYIRGEGDMPDFKEFSNNIPPWTSFRTDIKNVYIEKGVSSIGNKAFSECKNLTSINIPNSVQSIGQCAFSCCKSLISVDIPNSVQSIEQSAFEWCESLVFIDIPVSVKNIGNYAFNSCNSLTSITIPNSITSIGDEVFSDCPLTSIIIPESVSSIGIDAFNKCLDIVVDEKNSNYTTINGVLFNKDKTELLLCSKGKKGEYKIPSTVTSIGNNAFAGCNDLTSIVIPNGITSIGEGAFSDCKNLVSISIPVGVKSIEPNTFRYCRSLTSIMIPSSITNIEEGAFVGTGLTAIDIPNSVTNIGDSAFSNCNDLLSITIPKSVTNIGNSAFEACYNLISVILPNSVTSICKKTFHGYNNLTSITIPDSVTNIDEEAFSNCTKLISIIIPSNVTNIGNYAFFNCNSLISIIMSDSVKSIGKGSFEKCTNLTSITIPDNVNVITEKTFSGCDNLTDIYLLKTTPPVCSTDAFSSKNITIHVPTGSKAAYLQADVWKEFKNIVEGAEI